MAKFSFKLPSIMLTLGCQTTRMKPLLALLLLFSIGLLVAQDGESIPITGTVTGPTGETLIGATVRVAGTTQGTVTDVDGNYSISAAPDALLAVSYTGFGETEVAVNNRTVIDIVLEEDAADLQEIVVVGYGTQRRRDLTGAIASAPLDAFREAPNTNILQSLNGTVPGLNVGQSATAGEDASINIRGQNSINGNTSPLIVLDGIVYRGRVSDINPNDIQSVDVLKDASSKAIYGAQAANGVLIITTKQGRSSRKPTITYMGNYTTQNPTQDRHLLSREEYLQAARDVDFMNAYQGPDFTQSNPDFNQETDIPFFGPLLTGLQDGTDFDWLGASQQNGYITDHILSVSGGGERTNYFISGGYTDQQGIVLNDNYNRKTVRVNLDVEVTDWLTLGVNSFGTFADYSGDSPNIGQVDQFSPLARPRDEMGEFVINPLGDNTTNPLLASTADDADYRNRLLGIFFSSIDVPFVPGLNYRINFSNNYGFFSRRNSNRFDGGLSGAAFKNTASNYDWTFDNILTYDIPLPGPHDVKVTALVGRNRIRNERTEARGVGYTNLGLSYNDLGQAGQQFIESEAYEESYSYQMGRVAYEFKDKYLLNATVRRDGFSGFAANNRSAVFPSVGVGWVVSEEGFMAGATAVDFLKLRASYGISGNLTQRYSSQARIFAGEDNRYIFGDGGQTLNGQGISSLANPDLKWERTAGTNVGVDFSLVDSRISGSLDYYTSNTTDLLFNLVLPGITGFTSITSNVGEVSNNGIELILNAAPVRGERFRWEIGFNIARNRNEIVSLLGFDNDDDGREDDLVASGLFIGEPIQTIFNYEIDGIYQIGDDIPDGYAVGTYRLRDQDGDGEITPDDRTIIGNEEPAYSFGIRNTLSYGDFTLRFFINSVQGGSNSYLGANEPLGQLTPGIAQNQNWYADIDYWSPFNTGATYRLPGTNTPFGGTHYFARSFVRLQDISLAYTLNRDVSDRLGLGSFKVFVSGKNLVTLTDWEGWDPETNSGLNDSRPLLGGFSFGVDVSF